MDAVSSIIWYGIVPYGTYSDTNATATYVDTTGDIFFSSVKVSRYDVVCR